MTLLSVSRYTERSPLPILRRFVQCAWASVSGSGEEPVLPDGCIDVVWDGTQLFVAGPDTGPQPGTKRGALALGVRFAPGMAPLFLGVPAVELRDGRVSLEHFWADASLLAEQLHQADGVGQCCELIEAAIATRLDEAPEPDGVVEHAARKWSRPPTVPCSADTDWLGGLSERQVRRRFTAAVGYGPKQLQRILRFQSFLHLSSDPRFSLAELAQLCGYFDQPHLARESARLSGRTPALLRRNRLGVRNVQDSA